MGILRRFVYLIPLVLVLSILSPASPAHAQQLTRAQKVELKQKLRNENLATSRKLREELAALRKRTYDANAQAANQYRQSTKGVRDRAQLRELRRQYDQQVYSNKVKAKEEEAKLREELNDTRLYNQEQIRKSYGLPK